MWWSPVLRPFLKTAEVRVGHAVSQARPHPRAWLQPTCFLCTVHHRDDLIAECGVALVKLCGRAHANGLVVGLDPAQVGCGCAGTVWDLPAHTVGLETETSSTGLKADVCFFTQAWDLLIIARPQTGLSVSGVLSVNLSLGPCQPLPTSQICGSVLTLDRAMYGKRSMARGVSGPRWPFNCPFRILVADTVGTPIPEGATPNQT